MKQRYRDTNHDIGGINLNIAATNSTRNCPVELIDREVRRPYEEVLVQQVPVRFLELLKSLETIAVSLGH
jgi:hypothetical protein